MQARRLPAQRGVFWLLEGLRLFRRNPPLITALTLTYLMVVQLLAVLLPGLGPILLPVLLPTLTLIVANGCRLVDEGRAPSKATLLHGITGNAPALLRLGVLQLGGAMLLVLVSALLNGGGDPLASLEAAPSPTSTPEEAAAVQTEMLGGLLQLMLLATPLIIAFWFAPFLVGWNQVTPFKSLFFSTVASWRNLAAMGMFALAAAVAAGVIPGFILIVLSQISGMAMSAALIAMRMMLIFLVAPILTASIYISYRDIFHSGIDTNA
jgi:hypothetical protein